MATCALLLFLLSNGWVLLMPNAILAELALTIARGDTEIGLDDLARVLRRFSVKPGLSETRIQRVLADVYGNAKARGQSEEMTDTEISNKLDILSRYVSSPSRLD